MADDATAELEATAFEEDLITFIAMLGREPAPEFLFQGFARLGGRVDGQNRAASEDLT